MTTAQLPARAVFPAPAQSENLPVRIYTDHLPRPDGTCLACGLRWPCHTFQKHLTAQANGRGERMGAHMTIWYLRFLGRPEYWQFGPDLHTRVFGWIDVAVRAEQAIERTPAAIGRAAVSYARNARSGWLAQLRGLKLPPWRGLKQSPARGVVRFGNVRDGGKVDHTPAMSVSKGDSA